VVFCYDDFMKTSKLFFSEIQEAERVSEARKGHRNAGFRLMRDRDLGHQVLSNGVLMEWHVPPPTDFDALPDLYLYPKDIPVGHVAIDGKLYETEELLKWLRWA
jgi:hypothetical protein